MGKKATGKTGRAWGIAIGGLWARAYLLGQGNER